MSCHVLQLRSRSETCYYLQNATPPAQPPNMDPPVLYNLPGLRDSLGQLISRCLPTNERHEAHTLLTKFDDDLKKGQALMLTGHQLIQNTWKEALSSMKSLLEQRTNVADVGLDPRAVPQTNTANVQNAMPPVVDHHDGADDVLDRMMCHQTISQLCHIFRDAYALFVSHCSQLG